MKMFRFPSCIFPMLFLVLATQWTHGQDPKLQIKPKPEELEIGKPVEREFKVGGEREHLFNINLSYGQYAKVKVTQLGIDVVERLLLADHSVLFESNVDPRTSGQEVLEFANREPGVSTIAVTAKQINTTGRYRIILETIRPADDKDRYLSEARRLNYEATKLWLEYKYDEALPLAQKASDIRMRESGQASIEFAVSLTTLANIYSDKGDYEKCEPLYLRAIAIREKIVGKEDISLSSVLNNLALLYKYRGDYVMAAEVFRRVLEIRQKNLEPNHLLIAGVLSNLGGVKRLTGDKQKAVEYYGKALKLRENALPPGDPEISISLMNLGNAYSEVAVSEPLYLRALSIREKAYGADSAYVAETLYNLAALLMEAGEDARAEPFAKRALAINEKALGPDHPITSYAVSLLASIYRDNGDYARSETLFLRAIAIKEKTQGLHHPDIADAYSSLSQVYGFKNSLDQALNFQGKANANLEFNLEINLAIGSESEKLKYIESLNGFFNRTLRFDLQFAPGSEAAKDQAAEMILRRKGRVLDAVADNISALRRRSNDDDRSLLDQLDKINKRLSDLVLNSNGNSDEYKLQIGSLTDERDTLEDQISRRANGAFSKTKPVNLAEIQSLIPSDAALIEFAVYDAVKSKSSYNLADPPSESHYAAYVLKNVGHAKSIDLGTTKDIDNLISKLRSGLRDPARNDVRELARSLDERVMQPIRNYIGNSKHLLISPDGQLNLIPFETLVDQKKLYLIEEHTVTYLTSGRDLLRLKTPRPSRSQVLLISNPLFGSSTSKIEGSNGSKKIVPAARGFSDLYFAQLSGTLQEARSVQELFPEATMLSGSQATEQAIEQANAPRILHIATHGFFLIDKNVVGEETSTQKLDSKVSYEKANPLMRSGIALAGANQHNGSGDDGILTALEASGLDLWGTKLVVLSACDTGLGEVKNGSGVYGLRRSFVLAGAETLVMSLWSVSDYTTRELMTGYYTNLKAGLSRAEALRGIQLKILNRKGREHPFYWAAFIQSGEWADLDGER